MNIISHIQKKPLETKVRLLWVILGVCFIILIGIWITADYFNHKPNSGNVFESSTQRWKDAQNHWIKLLPQKK